MKSEEIIKLLNDLEWLGFDYDRMSSSGKELYESIIPKTKKLAKEYLQLKKLSIDIKKKKLCNCPYCGEPNNSLDPNLLCSQCREDFGHSLYSEL